MPWLTRSVSDEKLGYRSVHPYTGRRSTTGTRLAPTGSALGHRMEGKAGTIGEKPGRLPHLFIIVTANKKN
jgi:hypothetical protein